MNEEEQHAVWERRQTELWDRIFQVTSDVVAIAESLNDSVGQRILQGELVKSAMDVGAQLVRANASNSAGRFEQFVEKARMRAVETDYWLRLIYVLQQQDDVQRDLSNVITQYAAIINMLQKFVNHVRSEPGAVVKHARGPKVSL